VYLLHLSDQQALGDAPLDFLLCYRKIGLEKLLSRGIKLLEVSVAEAPKQMATYRAPLPQDEARLLAVETSSICVKPKPCFIDDTD
jgi:hypothetical protein